MCSIMFFFFNDTATTEIYTLSLHDALPISPERRFASLPRRRALRGRALRPFRRALRPDAGRRRPPPRPAQLAGLRDRRRSEEHTSELQSRQYIVCRLLLEKKNKTIIVHT